MTKDSLEKVKDVARVLAGFHIEKTEYYPAIVCHPFTNTGFAAVKGYPGIANIAEDEEARKAWFKQIVGFINSAKSMFDIMVLMNKPYYLYYLDLCREYITKEDMGLYLSEAWMQVEYPMSNNSIYMLLDLFNYADKRTLMSEDEYEQLNNMAEYIDIYRGSSGKSDNDKMGLSWTLSKDKAEWFAHRFNQEGYVFSTRIPKNKVIAYFNRRDEDEIIINPYEIDYESIKISR